MESQYDYSHFRKSLWTMIVTCGLFFYLMCDQAEARRFTSVCHILVYNYSWSCAYLDNCNCRIMSGIENCFYVRTYCLEVFEGELGSLCSLWSIFGKFHDSMIGKSFMKIWYGKFLMKIRDHSWVCVWGRTLNTKKYMGILQIGFCPSLACQNALCCGRPDEYQSN